VTRAAPAIPTFPDRGWFEKLDGVLRADTELAVIGRWCTLDLALVVDEETVLLRLQGGGISAVVSEPDIGESWHVTLRGTREDWRTFLRPIPPPFYQDLLAMNSRVPSFSIEGNRRAFVRHLRALSRIFDLARRVDGENAS
jgi:hypothetical protein